MMPNVGTGSAMDRLHAALTNAASNPNPVTRHVCRAIVLQRLYADMPPPRPKEMPHPDPIMSAMAQWQPQPGTEKHNGG